MDTILRKALRANGPLNRLIANLGGQDGDQWEQQLKQFLRKEPCWINGEVAQAPAPKPLTDLLEFISTIGFPATTSKFVAEDKFTINTKSNMQVKISSLGYNFTNWFLSHKGKTEDSIGKNTIMDYFKLRNPSTDYCIVEALGGEAKAEIYLSEMFFLMEKQKNGENGILSNNFVFYNIFYIKDRCGVLRRVYMFWNCTGWDIDADNVVNPYGWGIGSRVFSRNSVLESLKTLVPAQV